MGVTKTNLIMGPASVFGGVVGSTEPTDVSTAWDAAFRNLGATEGGVKIIVNRTFANLAADQIVDVPGRRLVLREVFVETNLAEATLDNLALLLNEPAPAAAVANVRTFQPTNGLAAIYPTAKAIGFEGLAPGGLKRRAVVRATLSIDNIEELNKKDGQKVYKARWAAEFVSDSIAPFVYLDGTA